MFVNSKVRVGKGEVRGGKAIIYRGLCFFIFEKFERYWNIQSVIYNIYLVNFRREKLLLYKLRFYTLKITSLRISRIWEFFKYVNMLRVSRILYFFKNFCNIYYIKKSNVRLNSNSSTSNCNFNFLETMILFKEYTNLEKFETFFTADTYNENKQKFLQFLLYLRLTRLLYNFINPLNDIEVYRTSFQSLEFPRIFPKRINTQKLQFKCNLYALSVLSISANKNGREKRKSLDRRRWFCFEKFGHAARIYISPLTIATPTVSFFEGQIDRYHLYFQTAASPRRQEILRNDSFARNSYKRGINHLYRGYNSIPLNSGKIIRQSESKF